MSNDTPGIKIGQRWQERKTGKSFTIESYVYAPSGNWVHYRQEGTTARGGRFPTRVNQESRFLSEFSLLPQDPPASSLLLRATRDVLLDLLQDAARAIEANELASAREIVEQAVQIVRADDGSWTEYGMHKVIQKILNPPHAKNSQ